MFNVHVIYSCMQSSANIAVARLNNHELGLKRIRVAISKPPRGQKVTGESSKEMKAEFVRPSFVPRGVQRQGDAL